MTESGTATLIERMFRAGAHFGFSKSRRHPSIAPFLFGTKEGYDIFDLEKTSSLLADACAFMKELGTNGKSVMPVGTKEEIADIIRTEAARTGLPYVANRWVGGTVTNFSEVKKRIEHLNGLRNNAESGALARKYTKKERLMLAREAERLAFNFDGISAIERTPDAMVVIDPRHEAIAVAEATQNGIPVIAILSSDCDLNSATKPVVVNDAHRASVALALSELMSAYLEGKAQQVAKPAPATPVVA